MSIEQGQAFFGNCERKLFVAFYKPKANTNYAVSARLRNDRDTHPLDLGSLTFLIRKRATGFEVELSQYTDSPYYALEYTVVEGHTQDAFLDKHGMMVPSELYVIEDDSGPPPFVRKCTCESWTLLHKGCQCGAVTKKKWGLGS